MSPAARLQSPRLGAVVSIASACVLVACGPDADWGGGGWPLRVSAMNLSLPDDPHAGRPVVARKQAPPGRDLGSILSIQPILPEPGQVDAQVPDGAATSDMRAVAYRVSVALDWGGSRTVRLPHRDGLHVGDRVRVQGRHIVPAL